MQLVKVMSTTTTMLYIPIIYLNQEPHSLMIHHCLVRYENKGVEVELTSNYTSASARHRVSPYELVTFEKAMDMIFHEVQPLGTSKQLVSASIPSFPCDVPKASRPQVTPALKGHVLAEDVLAPQNVPFTKTTSVDGYALRCKFSFEITLPFAYRKNTEFRSY
jgi:gephyrin